MRRVGRKEKGDWQDASSKLGGVMGMKYSRRSVGLSI